MKTSHKLSDVIPNSRLAMQNEVMTDLFGPDNFSDILCISGSFFYLILDVNTMTYQYVSPWIKHVLGYAQGYFLERGITIFSEIYHPDIINTQKAIQDECLLFLEKKTLKYRPYYKFSFDLQVRDASNNYVRLLQHNRYIKFDKSGKPLLLLSIFMKLPSGKNDIKQTLCISRMMPQGEKVLIKKDFFPQFENGILTKTEIEVWNHIVDGLSAKEISGKMGITVNTVNTHRKNIYKKIKKKTINLLQ